MTSILTEPIYGLTLWPEWAWAMAWLDKDVENRTWAPEARYVGKLFAIHGGKSIGGRPARIAVADGIDTMLDTALRCGHHVTCSNTQAPVGAPVPMRVHRDDGTDVHSEIACSAIVMLARLRRVIEADRVRPDETLSPWFCGPFGWVFEERIRLVKPVAVRGAQKIWLPSSDTRREILAQLP